jgi:hypothetical protein
MDKAEMWELAKDSAAKVAVVAAQHSAKEAQNVSIFRRKMSLAKRLGDLAGYLQCVSCVFDKHAAQSQSSARERVDDFLQGLEHLCTFNVSHGPISVTRAMPSFSVLRTDELTDGFRQWSPEAILNFRLENGSLLRFPVLNALKLWLPGQDSDLAEEIALSLKTFLSSDLMAGKIHTKSGQGKSKSLVRNYFAFLETFLSTRDGFETQVQEAHAAIAARSAKDVEALDDFPAHVHETFYKTLKKYSQCCCSRPGAQLSPLHHQGKLLLKEKTQVKDDDVIFDTVFSRPPQRDSAGDVEWQHLQFHISMYTHPTAPMITSLPLTLGVKKAESEAGGILCCPR